MIFVLWTVKDRAVNEFGPVHMARSQGEAQRQFSDAVNTNDKNNQLFQHPEDFDAYLLGEYDSETGAIVFENVSQFARAVDLLIDPRFREKASVS